MLILVEQPANNRARAARRVNRIAIMGVELSVREGGGKNGGRRISQGSYTRDAAGESWEKKPQMNRMDTDLT